MYGDGLVCDLIYGLLTIALQRPSLARVGNEGVRLVYTIAILPRQGGGFDRPFGPWMSADGKSLHVRCIVSYLWVRSAGR